MGGWRTLTIQTLLILPVVVLCRTTFDYSTGRLSTSESSTGEVSIEGGSIRERPVCLDNIPQDAFIYLYNRCTYTSSCQKTNKLTVCKKRADGQCYCEYTFKLKDRHGKRFKTKGKKKNKAKKMGKKTNKRENRNNKQRKKERKDKKERRLKKIDRKEKEKTKNAVPESYSGELESCPKMEQQQMGVCTFECDSDNDCKRGRKCCSNGCGRQCMRPVTNVPEEIKSEIDKSRKIVLPYVPRKESKQADSQSCPKIDKGQMGTCIQGCSSDKDCKESKKCCSNGCGNQCMTPVVTKVPPAKPEIIKPDMSDSDSCPKVNKGTMGICTQECESDKDCKDDKKCCSNECGKQCMEVKKTRPAPGKPDTKPTEGQPKFCFGGTLKSEMSCYALINKWTYNSKKSQCEEFNYGGCNGTENVFDTKEDCEKTCAKK